MLPVNHVVRSFSIRVHDGSLVLFLDEPWSASIDLSKATKLADAIFWPESMDAEWITNALQTVTPDHRDLRQISIHVPSHFTPYGGVPDERRVARDETYGEWLELDRLLVQLWESYSLRPRVTYTVPNEEQRLVCMRDCIGQLLPEITERGIINLVEC